MPIIFLTAKAQAADVKVGISLGARHYVQKPFSIADLLGKVDEDARVATDRRRPCYKAARWRTRPPGSSFPPKARCRCPRAGVRRRVPLGAPLLARLRRDGRLAPGLRRLGAPARRDAPADGAARGAPRVARGRHDERRGVLLAAGDAAHLQRLQPGPVLSVRPRRLRLPGGPHRSHGLALRARVVARMAGAARLRRGVHRERDPLSAPLPLVLRGHRPSGADPHAARRRGRAHSRGPRAPGGQHRHRGAGARAPRAAQARHRRPRRRRGHPRLRVRVRRAAHLRDRRARAGCPARHGGRRPGQHGPHREAQLLRRGAPAPPRPLPPARAGRPRRLPRVERDVGHAPRA